MGIREFAEKIMGTTRVSYDQDMEEIDEYVEVKPKKNPEDSKVKIKYYVLNDYNDIKSIIDYVREGSSIILANIRPLKSKDIQELKRVISKIKKTCEAVGGDVVGIEENFILVYPDFASVSKEDFE